MGWEKRGQSIYYYRKVRRGPRVVTQYVGKGEAAELAARLAEENKRKRKNEQMARRMAKQELRARILAAENAAVEFEKLAQAITRAQLYALGYHLHKGQWRLKRVQD